MDYNSYFNPPTQPYPFYHLPSKPEHPYTPHDETSNDPIVGLGFLRFCYELICGITRTSTMTLPPSTLSIPHTSSGRIPWSRPNHSHLHSRYTGPPSQTFFLMEVPTLLRWRATRRRTSRHKGGAAKMTETTLPLHKGDGKLKIEQRKIQCVISFSLKICMTD